MNRKAFLGSFVPFAQPDLSSENMESPPPEVIALNRITYGAIPSDIDKVKKIGLLKFIDEQLNPTDDEGEIVKTKLATITLPIKYPEKAGVYPAVDEDRLLLLINAPQEKLWDLMQHDTPYQEKGRPFEEIKIASWIRAVYSPWQLKEVMVEFWHNHFNVTANSDLKISLTFPVYDRDVIRKNCFGNFRTFLEAVAKSTAMLYYLDNFSSKASPANENFARELFELHTLGSDFYFNNLYNRWREVPGALEGKPIGYIDEDVYEAARAFTGWTVADNAGIGRGDKLPNGGAFYYYDGWHDNYQKRVLGVEFDPNQPPMADGLKVLDLVAYHPATAKNICKKLCRRFIADEPPQRVINGAVKVWTHNQKSPDQIKETIRYILSTKEFTSAETQKVKRPFELLASMFRVTGADFTPNASLTGYLAQMGYQHYQWPSPTGHPDKSSYWLSSNAMLARWNAAAGLLYANQNKVAKFDTRAVTPSDVKTFKQVSDYWTKRVLQKNKSEQFIESMALYMAGKRSINDVLPDPEFNNRVMGMVMLLTMTPDFQLK